MIYKGGSPVTSRKDDVRRDTMTKPLSIRSIFYPRKTFQALASADIAPSKVLFSYALWLLFLPPAFAWLGAYAFGWRIGGSSPLYLTPQVLTLVSVGYFLLLLFGYISAGLISQWFAGTYGARRSLGHHFALMAIVGTPLALASAAHLFPHVIFNVLVLIPTLIWSMYLLYMGVPVILQTPPERGVLMASSLLGYLLVAFVSLLGITVALWAAGFGPLMAV